MSLREFELPTALFAAHLATSTPRRVQGRFLKGPVPMVWLQRAAGLPGKSLHLGVVLWYRAGLTGSMAVKLGSSDLTAMGVARDAKYDGLRRLAGAGLIAVRQQPGCAPIVTLLLPKRAEA